MSLSKSCCVHCQDGGVRFVNFAGEWLMNSQYALSVCVNAGLIPLTSAYFGRMNLLSLITSSVGIAAGMGVLCAGWATALLHGFAPHIARIAAFIAKLFLRSGDRGRGRVDGGAGLRRGIHACDRQLVAAGVCAAAAVGVAVQAACADVARGVRVCGGAARGSAAYLPPLPGEGMDYVMGGRRGRATARCSPTARTR